jgi:hypothetical protein
MKQRRWVLATGFVAGLLACCLIVSPFVRDQMLLLTRAAHERSEGAKLARHLVSTDALLQYCVEHPEQVALASWEIGDETHGIAFNAERSQPVAHTSALLVLAAFAAEGDAAVAGRTTVPLAHWERYWLPGTDGGAHLAAVLEARARGALPPAHILDAASPASSAGATLDTIVRAMLRHADPAAMDVLLERVGRERLAARVLGLGFGSDALPLPASGVQLALLAGASAPELLARYRALPHSAYSDAIWSGFEQLRADDALRARSIERLEQRGLREAAELSDALSPRGSAGAYAQLMQHIAQGELEGATYMRTQLDLPLPAAGNGSDLAQLSSLRSSQPGMYSAVAIGRAATSERPRVLALLLRKLPIAVWLHLSSGSLLQRFEAQLLSDEAFFEKAKAVLKPQDSVSVATRERE